MSSSSTSKHTPTPINIDSQADDWFTPNTEAGVPLPLQADIHTWAAETLSPRLSIEIDPFDELEMDDFFEDDVFEAPPPSPASYYEVEIGENIRGSPWDASMADFEDAFPRMDAYAAIQVEPESRPRSVSRGRGGGSSSRRSQTAQLEDALAAIELERENGVSFREPEFLRSQSAAPIAPLRHPAGLSRQFSMPEGRILPELSAVLYAIHGPECGPFYAEYDGEGPFWKDRGQDESVAECPVDLVFEEEYRDELLKAKAKIWEMELQRGRDAWNLHFEMEDNCYLRETNHYLRRINQGLEDERGVIDEFVKTLERGKAFAEDDANIAERQVREIQSLRAHESRKLVKAQMEIEDLKEELRHCLYSGKSTRASSPVVRRQEQSNRDQVVQQDLYQDW